MTICKKCTQTNVHTSFNIIKYMQFDVWGMKSETAVKHDANRWRVAPIYYLSKPVLAE